MKRLLRSQFSKVCLFSVLAIVLLSGTVSSQEPRNPGNVVVSFGAGLNTAGLPPNPANHHVLPQTVRIKAGAVVNFAVAGFHQIYVYLPGKRPEDVILPPVTVPPALFINDLTNIYYAGILPAGGPPGTPPTGNPSNASNRMEPVVFNTPGTYLVICNVQPHFLEGMIAWVIVS